MAGAGLDGMAPPWFDMVPVLDIAPEVAMAPCPWAPGTAPASLAP